MHHTAAVQQQCATWGLDRLNQRQLPLDGTYSYDWDGTGVTAFILDSGIRSTHDEFEGRVECGYNGFADNFVHSNREDCEDYKYENCCCHLARLLLVSFSSSQFVFSTTAAGMERMSLAQVRFHVHESKAQSGYTTHAQVPIRDLSHITPSLARCVLKSEERRTVSPRASSW